MSSRARRAVRRLRHRTARGSGVDAPGTESAAGVVFVDQVEVGTAAGALVAGPAVYLALSGDLVGGGRGSGGFVLAAAGAGAVIAELLAAAQRGGHQLVDAVAERLAELAAGGDVSLQRLAEAIARAEAVPLPAEP